MFKKALILIAFLLSNPVVPAFAIEKYNDIEQHWAQEEIMKFSELGILKGSNGEFRPNDSITRGELSVILDRIMKYKQASPNIFLDLDNKFYTEAILKANYIGIMKGFQNKVRPNDAITREEATVMLSRVLNINSTKETTSFLDNNDISYWALPTIATLSDLGVVQGVGNNEFKPKENITRSAIVKILDNTIEEIYSTKGTYTNKVDGNLIINTPNVTVKDTKISGNIIISEGVSIDEVFFEDVKVNGDIIINSTSEDSINFKNCVVDGTIVLNKEHTFVNLKNSTTVNKIETFAKSTIKIDMNSTVSKLIANAETSIECNGKIIHLLVNSDNVISQIKPDQITVMANKKYPVITKPQNCDRVLNNYRPSLNPAPSSCLNSCSNSFLDSDSSPDTSLNPDLSSGSIPDLSSDPSPDSSSDPSSTPVKTYNIFFDESLNKAGLLGGNISTNKITARAGEEITILYTLESGYGMKEILMNGTPVTGNTFTMPNEDVVISFKVIKKEYRIGFDPTSDMAGLVDGAITTNKEIAKSDETITVLYDLKPGYVMKEILVNGAPISSNTFTMPNEDVVISFTVIKKEYRISFDPTSDMTGLVDGTITTDKETAESDEIITVLYDLKLGYIMKEILANGVPILSNNFVMPTEDVTISFIIEQPLYNISFLKNDDAFESFEINKTHAAEGDEIIITYEVAFPYHVDYMIFDETFIKGKKFIMPAKDIEIYVSTYTLH